MSERHFVYLSASEVQRRANVPASFWRKLKRAGRVIPDATGGGRTLLFKPERVAEVQRLMQESH